jgi:NADPH2:quinone reductase
MASETHSSHTTNALVVTRHGGPDVLEVQQRELAEPGPGQLLVQVDAAGVNFMDVYQRQGIYPTQPPFVIGGEGAGVVRAIGSNVTDAQVGDRVAWAQGPGSAAGYTVVDERVVVPVPEGLDTHVAAAALLQGMTAHYLVNSTYPVREGDWVLVHAAAGGVGQLLTQLAKAKGATVIGTVSTAEKAAKARSVGADHIVNYTEAPDVAAAVRELTSGVGVAVVYDGVGKDTFEASLASLKPRGMLVLFGASSGQVPPFDLQRLNPAGSLFVTRPTMVHYVASREELLTRGTEILDAISAGTVKLEIGGRYPLADGRTAYEDLEGRKTTGKLLLIP